MHGVCESVKSLSGISVVAQICSCASYQEKHARDLILESTCPVLSKRILLLLTVRREYLATSPVSIGSEPPMKTMELSRLSPPACAAESRAAAIMFAGRRFGLPHSRFPVDRGEERPRCGYLAATTSDEGTQSPVSPTAAGAPRAATPPPRRRSAW